MRSRHLLAALTALIALPIASPAAAHPQDTAINGVYGRMASSRTANDVPGMAAGFHPQALLVDARPGKPVLGADLAAVLAPQRDRIARDGVAIDTGYRIEQRQVIGDDLAVDAGFMRQAMRRPGAPETVRYARFLVIDLVVASVLMSMGMMMLPPVVVSLPFKLIFFVLVDGWRLVAGSLVQGFAL